MKNAKFHSMLFVCLFFLGLSFTAPEIKAQVVPTPCANGQNCDVGELVGVQKITVYKPANGQLQQYFPNPRPVLLPSAMPVVYLYTVRFLNGTCIFYSEKGYKEVIKTFNTVLTGALKVRVKRSSPVETCLLVRGVACHLAHIELAPNASLEKGKCCAN